MASISSVQDPVWGNCSELALKGLHSFWRNKTYRHQREIMQVRGLTYEVDTCVI